ncbi:MAG: hypothetical protein ACXWID_18695 [Pyrinomonadaceae bacterium]
MSKRVKSNYSIAWWAACFLGAVDGLLIGFMAEGLRLKYEAHQIEVLLREAEQRNLRIGYLMNPAMNLQIPIICLVAFALISPIVLRCLINRPQLLFYLWVVLGATAFALGYFMGTSDPNLLSYLWSFGLVATIFLVHRLWKQYPDSPPLLWAVNGISAVIVVAVGVQLVGLFYHWPELRSALVWLLFLVGVVLINGGFGAVVQVIANRLNARGSTRANAQ